MTEAEKELYEIIDWDLGGSYNKKLGVVKKIMSIQDEQVKKEKKIQEVIYKEMLRRKLDEIEKSLMSDKEIMKTSKKGYEDIYSEGVHDGLHIQRNKTQEVINKLKK